jgi:hypothetical protein
VQPGDARIGLDETSGDQALLDALGRVEINIHRIPTSKNDIRGGQIGIAVVADAVDTTGLLIGDKISGTSVAPVREFSCCGFTATAIVKKH